MYVYYIGINKDFNEKVHNSKIKCTINILYSNVLEKKKKKLPVTQYNFSFLGIRRKNQEKIHAFKIMKKV